ncbi:tetratricopeptide repeat protein, partial [Arthrospira platensis SPKY1]|nr:tetratricopeptide repeat protein [Arthrospira platensis SPKY1]
MNTFKALLITTLTVVAAGTFISCETSSQQKSVSSQYHTSTGFMNPQTMLNRWGTDSTAVKKELDEQAEALRAAKENDPENAGTLSKLGETLYERCRLSEARDVFLEALKLDPENSRNNYLL